MHIFMEKKKKKSGYPSYWSGATNKYMYLEEGLI